ncbi:hypothetical protein CAPTEDRAFT_176040 [Capitella teleta]|uniref:Nuclear pore complex protein n=1 Tax=Capitella teleta TaxID=283909 RepID=R7UGZ2_CAPTE|nr:hypothetical protein CAPTEDRAFT_176040 [Capitella teleta]|eukprot:ELU05475.1 hypothetical protein CAPTEDRAFT_176040 [Capitella teleta]
MPTTADVTTTNAELIIEDDPQISSCKGLFNDFKESFSKSMIQGNMKQMLTDYESMCEQHYQLLRRLLTKVVPGQEKFVRTVEMMNLVNQERCTWRLLTSLFADREQAKTSQPMEVSQNIVTAQDLICHLYDNDAKVRQAQLVVDWLEQNALDQLEDIYDPVKFFTDKMGAWWNTLHALNQKKPSFHSERTHVTKLDPDAPTRQKLPLTDLDVEDEGRLSNFIFACIQAGQLDEAQNLCTKVGEVWKAAAMEGWRLYHDPNLSGLGQGGTLNPVSGNPNRDLWKTVCWRLASDEKVSRCERAIYAAFCGHLEALLPSCKTWHDHLWAFMRVFVDQRVEEHLHTHYVGLRPLRALPDGFASKRISVESVFQELSSSTNEDVRQQSKYRFHLIQQYIILSDMDSLVEEVHEWARDEAHPPAPQFLRCLAHLLLFLQATGATSKDGQVAAVVEAYVSHLIDTDQRPLVAAYVATLPSHLQVHLYATFLKGIRGTEERKSCLKYAEESGLTVNSITRMLVETVRSENLAEATCSDTNQVSDSDQEKIDAIEWMTFDPLQRSEAMKQANAIMRSFLASKKLLACKKAFDQLPVKSIDVIFKNTLQQTGNTELSNEDGNAVKEYLCIKAYLDAHDAFNEWFAHYHGRKPTLPEPPSAANYMERVAHEHRVKEHKVEVAQWQSSLDQLTKRAEESLYNVLLFVTGGWMVDQNDVSQEEGGRLHQMRLLRQLCLPQICFLLHTVLHSTKQHHACLQLADLVASENHLLYRSFGREELQKLLSKIRESCLELLDAKLDPLGYELA